MSPRLALAIPTGTGALRPAKNGLAGLTLGLGFIAQTSNATKRAASPTTTVFMPPGTKRIIPRRRRTAASPRPGGSKGFLPVLWSIAVQSLLNGEPVVTQLEAH